MKQMPPRLAAWYGLDDDASAAESSVQSTTRSGTTYQPTSSITSAQSTRQSKENFTVSLPLFAALAIAVSLASIVNKDQLILQFEGDGEGYLWEDDDDVYATTIADSNTDIITIEMPTTPENTSEPSLAAGSAAHAHASLRPRKAYASLLPPVPPASAPSAPSIATKTGAKTRTRTDKHKAKLNLPCRIASICQPLQHGCFERHACPYRMAPRQ